MNNTHNSQIPKEILDSVMEKLKAVKTEISEYVHVLTVDDRRKMPKMGDKSFSFVNKSFEYSQQHPEFMPAYYNPEDFANDMADATGLLPLKDILKQLLSEVEDTTMLAGSEALNHSLLFYNNTKRAALNHVPGAKEVYDDLKQRFPGRPKDKDEPEE